MFLSCLNLQIKGPYKSTPIAVLRQANFYLTWQAVAPQRFVYCGAAVHERLFFSLVLSTVAQQYTSCSTWETLFSLVYTPVVLLFLLLLFIFSRPTRDDTFFKRDISFFKRKNVGEGVRTLAPWRRMNLLLTKKPTRPRRPTISPFKQSPN